MPFERKLGARLVLADVTDLQGWLQGAGWPLAVDIKKSAGYHSVPLGLQDFEGQGARYSTTSVFLVVSMPKPIAAPAPAAMAV